jgi:hypothetical protein
VIALAITLARPRPGLLGRSGRAKGKIAFPAGLLLIVLVG